MRSISSSPSCWIRNGIVFVRIEPRLRLQAELPSALANSGIPQPTASPIRVQRLYAPGRAYGFFELPQPFILNITSLAEPALDILTWAGSSWAVRGNFMKTSWKLWLAQPQRGCSTSPLIGRFIGIVHYYRWPTVCVLTQPFLYRCVLIMYVSKQYFVGLKRQGSGRTGDRV